MKEDAITTFNRRLRILAMFKGSEPPEQERRDLPAFRIALEFPPASRPGIANTERPIYGDTPTEDAEHPKADRQWICVPTGISGYNARHRAWKER
ncbi:MAG: hypothetical protein U1F59_11495 [Candidatus Competibacteraceae bacterium]